VKELGNHRCPVDDDSPAGCFEARRDGVWRSATWLSLSVISVVLG
jgi:hypothetical protein